MKKSGDKKKNPTEVLRKKCVTLAKKIVVKLANETCEHCGKRKSDGWQMHGSHNLPEGVYKSMSADLDNITCLCASCHTGGFWKNANKVSWHEDPLYFSDWFETKFQGRKDKLLKRSQKIVVCDLIYWQKKHEDLKEQLVLLKEKYGIK